MHVGQYIGAGMLILMDVFFTTCLLQMRLPMIQKDLHFMVGSVQYRNCELNPNGCMREPLEPNPFPSVYDSFSLGYQFMMIGLPTLLVTMLLNDGRLDQRRLASYPIVWTMFFAAEAWGINFMAWFADVYKTMAIEFKMTCLALFVMIIIGIMTIHGFWFVWIEARRPAPKFEPKEETPLKTVDI